MKCLICGSSNETEFTVTTLARHLQFQHKTKSIDYTWRYLLGLSQLPTCKVSGCVGLPRYTTFAFKSYCKDHGFVAESLGGKFGGKHKKTWNKGLTKENDDRLLKQALLVSGAGNHFYGKHHSSQTINKLKKVCLLSEEGYLARLKVRDTEFEVLTSYKDYVSRQKQKLECRCLKCNAIEKKTLMAFERGSLCKWCFPENMTSKDQLNIFSYIQTNLGFKDADICNRTIIPPKELDIVVPSKLFAVEYNGLFWHSIEQNPEKEYHLNKTLACQKSGFTLFHIFSDEWLNKPEIVKSMLSNKLGQSKKIDARKCSVKELSVEEARSWFDNTHISGHVACSKTFGLFLENELVCALSLREPIRRGKNEKENEAEIARFSSKLFCVVRGGFSRLLHQAETWAKENGYSKIITYADLRFGTGNVYDKCGFVKAKENTGINYWYTNGKERFNRFKFRAQDNLSEKQVASKNSVYKIYGCGNALFEKAI